MDSQEHRKYPGKGRETMTIGNNNPSSANTTQIPESQQIPAQRSTQDSTHILSRTETGNVDTGTAIFFAYLRIPSAKIK